MFFVENVEQIFFLRCFFSKRYCNNSLANYTDGDVEVFRRFLRFGGIAQLVERPPCTRKVRGSNPLASTIP